MKALSLSGPLVTAALPCPLGRWNVGRARAARRKRTPRRRRPPQRRSLSDGRGRTVVDREGRIAGERERKKLVNLKIEAQG